MGSVLSIKNILFLLSGILSFLFFFIFLNVDFVISFVVSCFAVVALISCSALLSSGQTRGQVAEALLKIDGLKIIEQVGFKTSFYSDVFKITYLDKPFTFSILHRSGHTKLIDSFTEWFEVEIPFSSTFDLTRIASLPQVIAFCKKYGARCPEKKLFSNNLLILAPIYAKDGRQNPNLRYDSSFYKELLDLAFYISNSAPVIS